MADPRQLDLPAFVRRVHYLLTEHPDCELVWFLGAGCSVSSGIPTAAGLARQWLPRLKLRDTGSEGPWEQWAEERFPGSATDAGSAYGVVMDELFPLQNERQREIERLTAEKDPGIGYALLALLMCHHRFGPQTNVVLTTNFDDLVQDAFYLVTPKKPLVVVHDSLAPFVRQSRTRPLIVKVHGDARLAPRNTVRETAELSGGMTSALARVLNDHALVFVGYGGNDQSIAGLIRALPPTTFPWGIYWVGERFPTGPVGDALRMHEDVSWVHHLDFDALMLEVAEQFELGAPSFDRWMQLRDTYQRTLGLQAEQPSAADASSGTPAAAERMSARLRARSLMAEAFSMADEPRRARSLFLRAVETAPDDPVVVGNFANFLTDVLQEHDEADAYYRRAIEQDAGDPDTLGNYAVFLTEIKGDHDGAEEYHRRALAADPVNVSARKLSNFAVFLTHVRHDWPGAEDYFRRAIESDGAYANALANYAQLLFILGRDDEALALVDRAVAAEPNNPTRLELSFYRYAHCTDDREHSLRELHTRMARGDRSPGWDLSQNVERANREGHPEPKLLADLARAIADKVPVDILNQYEAWRTAGKAVD